MIIRYGIKGVLSPASSHINRKYTKDNTFILKRIGIKEYIQLFWNLDGYIKHFPHIYTKQNT